MPPPGLTIRDYTPADDAAAKTLEVTASQFQGFRGLVKAAIVHHSTVDAKPKQFADHILLVCVDEASQAVCGVVVVAIKQAFVLGTEQRCGFVFDLRVDERFQRRGIGEALARELEARCAKRGVQYLYLSVNRDTPKARRLSQKLGWSPASRRRLLFALTFWPGKAAPPDAAAAAAGGGVVLLPPAEALELTAAHFARRDLGLSRPEVERLFSSPLHLGTWACSDGAGSHAALSLWHGSALSTFSPVTLLLPVTTWARLRQPLAAAAALALLAAAPLAAAALAHTPPLAKTALLVALGSAARGAVYAYGWVRSRSAFRARLYAPVGQGPKWEPLMRAVHAALHAEARRRGFTMAVVNEDTRSPLVACLGRGGDGPTEFWQKRLAGGAGGAEALPQLAPDAFFDPRDI